MNLLDKKRSRLCALAVLLLTVCGSYPTIFAQEALTNILPGWQVILDQPGLSPEQRQGARFAAQHLPVSMFTALPERYQETLLHYAADHSDGDPRLVLCWEKHTPYTIVKPFLEIEYAGKLVKASRHSSGNQPIGTAYQANDSDHWSQTASNGGRQGVQGLPVTLTWSIVPDGTLIPGGEVSGEGSNEPSNLRAWLAGIYGGSATEPAADQPWFPIVQAVFDNISAKTGVRYVYEPNDDGTTLSSLSSGQGVLGVRGDVRISGHRIDGNYNVLAYDYFPDFSDMVLDTSDSFFDNTANNSRGLRNVIEHEHGHGLGLSHVCPIDNTKLMEPYINLGFVGVQFDDIFTIQRLYGDFLEVHEAYRDNDSFATATPLNVSAGAAFTAQWLGIDDDTDTDYFSFNVPAGSQLTVRAMPSTASYLEGAQNPSTGSCSAGTTFDSSILQNLGLTIFGPDQSTVLASATNQPAGSAEAITNLVIDTGGTYYARVTGSGANVNQLYQLEVDLSVSSYAIQMASATIVDELLPNQNGAPDPGETVRLDVALENIGQGVATNLTATLSGPAGFQGFDVSSSYGEIDSGSNATGSFTFALNGQCGETFPLSLNIKVNGVQAGVLPVNLMLGTESYPLQEDFDGSTGLPSGWGTTESGQGSLWSVVSSPSNPGHNSAFAVNGPKSGESVLTTPPISIGSAPGSMVFTHFYDTEPGSDGGVLEILIGNGSWQDILSAGGTFVSGGYNTTLDNSPNPISGRDAWSGNSGGFITTAVALPSATANQTIQLRWILGQDQHGAGNGWYLEDINLSEVTCQTGVPVLNLSSADASMSEYSNATDTALITVSAGLPVPTDFPVTLMATGTADPALDVAGLGNLTLTTGNASTSLVLSAISDGVVEGDETLTITSPDATGSVQLTILDTPYGEYASALLGTIGPVNPFDDFDSDGSPNIEELVFGSDLKSAASRPVIGLQPDGEHYRLPAALSLLPEGILAEAESSTNFQTWTTNDISTLPDGFLIPANDPQRFVRLKYSVQEAAP